jgi:molecular chaperone DnaK
VEIHILQGERPMANQNKSIGRFHLDGIPPSQRGIPQIEVTFDIDANGILHVTAKDKATGKSQQIRIEASSGLSDEDIRRMREEAQVNAETDKRVKEEVDKLNQADTLVFQTEKQLKEFGEKIPADKKEAIEKAVEALKNAHKNRDFAALDASIANLNAMWQTASEEMYKNASQSGPQGGPQGGPQQEPGQNQQGPKGSGNDEVTDVDFEEVKDK